MKKPPDQVERFRHYFIADLPEDLSRGDKKKNGVEAYLDLAIINEGTVGETVNIEGWGCSFDKQWIQQPVWITEETREREKAKAIKEKNEKS